MTKTALLVSTVLCAAGSVLVLASHAHADEATKKPQTKETKDLKEEPLQRRAAVRAALDPREQKREGAALPSVVRRQLTAPERQELRQQLLLQRSDAAKP